MLNLRCLLAKIMWFLMPDSPQVFVRFEGFAPSGHVVMPEEDRAFSLFGRVILAARLLARSFAKDLVFFHR